jgi:hypothetical protein
MKLTDEMIFMEANNNDTRVISRKIIVAKYCGGNCYLGDVSHCHRCPINFHKHHKPSTFEDQFEWQWKDHHFHLK